MKLEQKTSKRDCGVAAGLLLPEAAHSKYTFAPFCFSAITQQRVTLLSLQYVMLWQIPEHHCTDTSKKWSLLNISRQESCLWRKVVIGYNACQRLCQIGKR
ncbi:hypothetical protein O4H50_02150 [Vibrio diazotrophicus]|uniref:hypothetical protein n=1 Tax=Vibrio diazotrophicus TaxID=685 RepID=UPI0022AEE3FF|nr:hypothetical protein [Vibrio diazotrophicus]MCZ4370584.1 hypothetical protein [Vibrio diazotrophicus]